MISNIESKDYRKTGNEKRCLAKRDLFYYAHANYLRNDDSAFPYDINCMLTIVGDGGDTEPGDVYFGTPQGLFFRTNGQPTRRNGNYDIKKIEGISNSVHLLCEHREGAIIAATYDNQLYYVDNNHNVKEDFDVSDPITTMITIQKNGAQSQAGDVYFGTTKGVYLRRLGETAYKLRGINGYVTILQEHLDGTVHVVLGEPREQIVEREKDEKIKLLNEKLSKLEDEKSSMNKTINQLIEEKLSLEEERENMNKTINNCQNEKAVVYKTLAISNEQNAKLEKEKLDKSEVANNCINDKVGLENENKRLEALVKKYDVTSQRDATNIETIAVLNRRIKGLLDELRDKKYELSMLESC